MYICGKWYCKNPLLAIRNVRGRKTGYHKNDGDAQCHSGVPRGGFGLFQFPPPPPPRNSEVLTKLNRIPSSVENISVTT
jgi:hypothetical protein